MGENQEHHASWKLGRREPTPPRTACAVRPHEDPEPSPDQQHRSSERTAWWRGPNI